MHRHSLKKTLVAVFLCASLLPVFALGAYSLVQSMRPARREIAVQLSDGVQKSIGTFDTTLGTYSERADSLTQSAAVRAFLEGKTGDMTALYRSMYNVNLGMEQNAVVTITDPDGKILTAVGITPETYDICNQQHRVLLATYGSQKSGNQPDNGFYPDSYALSDGTKMALAAIRRITDPDGETSGYVFVEIPQRELMEILRPDSNVQVGSSFIQISYLVYTKHNYIVVNNAFDLSVQADERASQSGILSLEFRDAFKTESPHAEYFDYRDTQYLLTGAYDRGDYYVVVGAVPVSLITENNRRIFTAMLILGAAAAAAGSILAVAMTNSVTRPLQKLIGTMRQVETGNFDVRTGDTGSYEEISTITRQMDGMIDQLDVLFAENDEKQRLLYDAERDSLQAQIRPHFINNTLEAIRYLIRMGQNDTAEEMVENLSIILRRYIRNNSQTETVLEAVEFVDAYLEIEKACYPDKISIEQEIDPEMEEEVIPSLILQPIVENAVRHGIQPVSGMRTVSLKGRKEGNDLLFVIADNGAGMSLEQVEAALVPSTSEHGNGLYNTDRRIKLFCGPGYGLNVSSEEGKGTEVTVRLRNTEGNTCTK